MQERNLVLPLCMQCLTKGVQLKIGNIWAWDEEEMFLSMEVETQK